MSEEKKNIGQKIAGAIDRVLSPPPPNTWHVLTGKFEKLMGRPILSRADLKTISAADGEWKKAWHQKNVEFTSVAAGQEYNRRLFKMGAGEAVEPDGAETLKSEYLTRSIGAEQRMKAINQQHLPTVKKAMENFVESGDFWIQDRLKAEKAEAEEFGVQFSPSAVLIAAQRTVATVKIQLSNLTPGQNSPASYLLFINLE